MLHVLAGFWHWFSGMLGFGSLFLFGTVVQRKLRGGETVWYSTEAQYWDESERAAQHEEDKATEKKDNLQREAMEAKIWQEAERANPGDPLKTIRDFVRRDEQKKSAASEKETQLEEISKIVRDVPGIARTARNRDVILWALGEVLAAKGQDVNSKEPMHWDRQDLYRAIDFAADHGRLEWTQPGIPYKRFLPTERDLETLPLESVRRLALGHTDF